MNKETDLRVRRTKRLLQEAFIELLQDIPFYKISVHALTQRAEINRVTFYLHYTDMDDFIEQFVQEWLQKTENLLLTKYDTPFDFEQELIIIQHLLEFIAQHERVYKVLLVTKEIPFFTPRLLERVRLLMYRRSGDKLEPNNQFNVMGIPDDIAIWYATSAMFGTIAMWLSDDMKYSPQYLAQQIVKLNPFEANIFTPDV